MRQLEEAIDRVIAGPERRTRLISDKEKRVIAYHESGPRAGRPRAAQRRPDPQGVDRRRGAAPSAGRWRCPTEDKYLVAAVRAARPAGDAARRAHRRGAHLRGPDHRRPERHREGNADRPGDGHPVRHERRCSARSSSARRHGEVFLGRDSATRPTTPTRSPPASTPRSAASSTRPTTRPARSCGCTAPRSTRWPTRSSRRRRSTPPR